LAGHLASVAGHSTTVGAAVDYIHFAVGIEGRHLRWAGSQDEIVVAVQNMKDHPELAEHKGSLVVGQDTGCRLNFRTKGPGRAQI